MIIAFKEGVFFLFTIKFSNVICSAPVLYIPPWSLQAENVFGRENLYREFHWSFLFERGVLMKINLSYEREFDSFF